ncbi:unnamed protein product, partial [Rotaria sordida]
EAVNRWIKEEFNRSSRAKCLIIIGPTGTGKTSFAISLPGRVNYFQERWNLDAWNDYARYSVYGDIPWDDFGPNEYFYKRPHQTTTNPDQSQASNEEPIGASDEWEKMIQRYQQKHKK